MIICGILATVFVGAIALSFEDVKKTHRTYEIMLPMRDEGIDSSCIQSLDLFSR